MRKIYVDMTEVQSMLNLKSCCVRKVVIKLLLLILALVLQIQVYAQCQAKEPHQMLKLIMVYI